MPKSIPMLPSLAGGSGVAAHTLTDNDLLWMVDASTLDADRDRKVTLAELKAAIVDTALTAKVAALQTLVTADVYGVSYDGITGIDRVLTSVSLSAGTWLVTLDASVKMPTAGDTAGVAMIWSGAAFASRTAYETAYTTDLKRSGSGADTVTIVRPARKLVLAAPTTVELHYTSSLILGGAQLVDGHILAQRIL